MKTSLPATPLIADMADLTGCLAMLGARPLKLVADSVCPQFCEVPWTQAKWPYRKKAGRVTTKGLLPFSPDTFQFSLAGKNSKQDYHMHRRVFEIYASHSPMRVRYSGNRRLRVAAGVLMVPPGTWHCVTLDGPAFVFQTVCGKGMIHDDRIV